SLAKALDFYRRALAIDSLNARSWAAVGTCYVLQSNWGWIDRNEGLQKARIAANKSIVLDNTQAKGHYASGQVKMWNFDWAGAEAEFQKALKLEPGNADVLRIIGFLYRCIGRFDEAIRLSKQSITLDPVQAITYFNYGQLLYHANHLEEAIVAYKKVLELNPQFPRAHIFLGKVYLLQGKPEWALNEMSQESNEAWRTFGLILAHQALGHKKEADKLLSDYIARFSKDNMFQIAEIYSIRGEKDKAFEYLEKAYIERQARLTYIKGDPLLKNLENDPRHTAFLNKMNLPVD
ncbi:MAG TPA: tetratricopeptide repeat protein, partial [Chitinophagaceae bacterium]|nr:tetratricopeptide repeat protein [Chitinophagaceae bacterium]